MKFASNLAANKIVTVSNLQSIFCHLKKLDDKYFARYQAEKEQNEGLAFDKQAWSVKDYNTTWRFEVRATGKLHRFYNYDKFSTFFKSHSAEINEIALDFAMNYIFQNKEELHNEHHTLTIVVTESSVQANSDDDGYDEPLDPIYRLIDRIFSAAPPRYDVLIRDQPMITFKSGFSLVLVLCTAIGYALIGVPTMRLMYQQFWFIYPITVLALSAVLGLIVGELALDRHYKALVPVVKHRRRRDAKSYYDLEDFMRTGEVQIGRNVNNAAHRNAIAKANFRARRRLIVGLVILVIASVVIYLVR